jgi:hypothetical protein
MSPPSDQKLNLGALAARAWTGDNDTVAHLGATIVRSLGYPHPTPRLAAPLIDPSLLEGIERIALVILDGFGASLLRRARERAVCPRLTGLLSSAMAKSPHGASESPHQTLR